MNGLPLYVFLVSTVPLILRGERLPALSGLLIGFGGCWSLLLVSQLSRGGMLDNADFWTAVGVAPLAIGLSLLLPVLVNRHAPAH